MATYRIDKKRSIPKFKVDSEQTCRICGCTWFNACPGGCYWVEEDLCSRCATNMKSPLSRGK